MIIAATDITYERHYEPVFEPVSLSVNAGSLLLLTGANGSGKTTLLRLLAGLLRPSQGEVHRTTPCVYVGHQLGIKDDLTVGENLAFMAGLAGHALDGPDTALRRVGIPRLAGREVRTLSAGQRKRCALARLLVAPAPLWLLDEPYSNLDGEGAAALDGLLAGHLANGGAAVLCTHGSLRPGNLACDELMVMAARKVT